MVAYLAQPLALSDWHESSWLHIWHNHLIFLTGVFIMVAYLTQSLDLSDWVVHHGCLSGTITWSFWLGGSSWLHIWHNHLIFLTGWFIMVAYLAQSMIFLTGWLIMVACLAQSLDLSDWCVHHGCLSGTITWSFWLACFPWLHIWHNHFIFLTSVFHMVAYLAQPLYLSD